MQNYAKFFVAFLFLFSTTVLIGQEEKEDNQPNWLVISYNKVDMQDMGKMMEMGDKNFGPILDALVEEGKLVGWGVLTHAWGDEWNYNIYYVTKDAAAFFDFWQEYVSRVDQAQWQEVVGMIKEHKDNMYSIAKMTWMQPE